MNSYTPGPMPNTVRPDVYEFEVNEPPLRQVMFTTAPDGNVPGHGSASPSLTLLVVTGRFAMCKLPPDSTVPGWATTGYVFSVTRAVNELSVVCPQEMVPIGTRAEVGWCCLRVAGTMPFSIVGVLPSLTTPIAAAGVGIFVVSTFDTDYLFVKEAEFHAAVAALRGEGHSVEEVLP